MFLLYGSSGLKWKAFLNVVENLPGVQDVCLSEHQPCDIIAITSWEQRYSTILPQKIKDFYLATDGFRLTWNYRHAGTASLWWEGPSRKTHLAYCMLHTVLFFAFERSGTFYFWLAPKNCIQRRKAVSFKSFGLVLPTHDLQKIPQHRDLFGT